MYINFVKNKVNKVEKISDSKISNIKKDFNILLGFIIAGSLNIVQASKFYEECDYNNNKEINGYLEVKCNRMHEIIDIEKQKQEDRKDENKERYDEEHSSKDKEFQKLLDIIRNR